MKKWMILFLAIGMASTMQAQKIGMWFDVGVKGAFGPTLMANSNIFNDRTYDHEISTGYGFGGKVGIYFGEYNGVTLDAIFSRSRQGFNYEVLDQVTPTFNHDIEWTSIDLYLLYRMQKAGVYFEIGPAYSMINKVTQDDQANPLLKDVSDFYNDDLISGVIGFGGYIYNNERFTLMMGLRASYALTDFVNETGKDANFPNPNRLAPYETYKSTNPIAVQVLLEANFGIGYFAKTCCSNRSTFFSK
jgi:hypothetical protein